MFCHRSLGGGGDEQPACVEASGLCCSGVRWKGGKWIVKCLDSAPHIASHWIH